MEYQININHSFVADSEEEARKKARKYLSNNLRVKVVPDTVCSPLEIANRCKDFRKAGKEYFCIFFLNSQNQIIDKEIISIGTLNSALIHPRECFRNAILKNCCSIILVHNHPSGSLEPSSEDLTVTKRLTDVGKLIGIEILDHVIVTGDSHKSFKEANLL
jgi:DNA repair protein RadC